MKLTREQWDAMTPDEQWEYVNQSPYQIGQVVNVHSWTVQGNRGDIKEPFIGKVFESYMNFGLWFYDVREVEPANPDKPRWVGGWPEAGLSEVIYE